MKNLLVLLGKRVHELRVAKGWSQEEFANVSGFHRTYVGQIERGEKNISFENLIKLASVLAVTASELLAVLDTAEAPGTAKQPRLGKRQQTAHHLQEMQKLLTRLKHQRSALDRTLQSLEELIVGAGKASRPSGGQ